jgi:hypothetical protein
LTASTQSVEAGHSWTGSFFEDPWWLDAVAPGSWREIRVADGDAQARMVFGYSKRFGLTQLRNPPLTQTVGPSLRLPEAKYESRLALIRKLVQGLIDALPPAAFTRLVMASDFDDFLPFKWAGYTASPACTYRIDLRADLDRLWAECSESCRRAIRKAQKQLQVRDDLPLDAVLRTASLSFSRQNRAVPYEQSVVVKAVDAARQHAGVLTLAAEDPQGITHASALIVYDQRVAYYLLGGADPQLRSSGAQSLLLWEALRRLHATVRIFDFEGSSNPNIERFFRGFGARRHQLLMMSKIHPLIELAGAARLIPRSAWRL